MALGDARLSLSPALCVSNMYAAHNLSICCPRLQASGIMQCSLHGGDIWQEVDLHLPLLQVDELPGPPLEAAAESTLEAARRGPSTGRPAGLPFQLRPWIPLS